MKHTHKALLASAIALTIAGCSDGGHSHHYAATSGRVIDGYIRDATVTCDLNNNKVADSGEPYTTTDDHGKYTFTMGCINQVIAKGGTDVNTGYPFLGEFLAKAGSPVITPITTLSARTGLSDADVVKLLGLHVGTNIYADPIATDNLELQKKTLMVQQVVQKTTEAISSSINSVSYSEASQYLSDSIKATHDGAPSLQIFDPTTGRIDTTTAWYQDAIDAINIDKSASFDGTAIIPNISTQISAINTAIDLTDLINTATTVQNPRDVLPGSPALNNYLAISSDTINVNSTPITLSQFTSTLGASVTGALSTVAFDFAPQGTPNIPANTKADLIVKITEQGGFARQLELLIQGADFAFDGSNVSVTVPTSATAYLYAKTSDGKTANLILKNGTADDFVTSGTNSVSLDYNNIIDRIAANSAVAGSEISSSIPSLRNLTGTFEITVGLSNNINLRQVDGTGLTLKSLGVTGAVTAANTAVPNGTFNTASGTVTLN